MFSDLEITKVIRRSRFSYPTDRTSRNQVESAERTSAIVGVVATVAAFGVAAVILFLSNGN